jgi:glycosyltransferase involved in cell wall biosynthesis
MAQGRAGVLVQPNDVDGLANALARCFANPDLSRQQGLDARALALSNFGMAGMVRQYLERFNFGRVQATHSSHANTARS